MLASRTHHAQRVLRSIVRGLAAAATTTTTTGTGPAHPTEAESARLLGSTDAASDAVEYPLMLLGGEQADAASTFAEEEELSREKMQMIKVPSGCTTYHKLTYDMLPFPLIRRGTLAAGQDNVRDGGRDGWPQANVSLQCAGDAAGQQPRITGEVAGDCPRGQAQTEADHQPP